VECTSCSTAPGNEYYYYQTLCYRPCPIKTFPSLAPTPNCTDCDAPCAKCSGNYQNCSSCIASYHFPSSGSKLCVPSCESNEDLEVLSNTCTVCPTGCTTCEKPLTTVECTSCSTAPGNEYYYYQTLCYRPCPTHTFPSLAPTPNCTDCDAPCAECSDNYQNCSSCISSYHFPSSGSTLCVGNCQSDEYVEATANLCTACPTGCATC
jgi:proprotein convertase subtilisin/kexin type 5